MGRVAKLLGQLDEHGRVIEIDAVLRNRGGDDILVGEVLEDSHQIAEGFMKGRHVWPRGQQVLLAQAVQQRVTEFVRDDVLRKAGEDITSGRILRDAVGSRAIVAKTDLAA